MSLEAALAENTAVMKQLITVLQSGALPSGATEAAAATAKGTRGKKGESAAPPPSGQTAETNAGTAVRYFHIPKHNTVAAVNPGEVVPSIESTVEIGQAEYESLKAKYSAGVPSSAAEGTSAPAATPVVSTPAAGPASSPASVQPPAASTADIGAQVLAKAQLAHKNIGNPGLMTVLKHFKVDSVPKLIANSAMHADAIKVLDACIALPGTNNSDHVAALIPQVLAPSPLGMAAGADTSLFG